MTDTPETMRCYSVTTILSEGIPKPALLNWVGRVVAEYAVDHRTAWQALAADDRDAAVKLLVDSRFRKTAKAADRGTAVHQFAEKIALGLDADEDDFQLPHFEQYQRFLHDHAPEFIAAEAPVVNLTYHYAGTLDNIVRIGDATVVLDVKTTDRGPDAKTRPPYGEVALQLAAYAHAERICLTPLPRGEGRGSRRYYTWSSDHPQQEMPAVDGGMVLVISPVDYILVPVRIDQEVFESFLHAREVARWQLQTSRTVFGAALAPTVVEPEVVQGEVEPAPLEQTVEQEAEGFGEWVEGLAAEGQAA